MNKKLITRAFLSLVLAVLFGWHEHTSCAQYAAAAYKGVCFLARWTPLAAYGFQGGISYYGAQHPQLSFPNSLEDGLKREYTPIQNEAVKAHLQGIAQSRNLHNLLFCKNDKTYIADITENIGALELCSTDAQILEDCLNKPKDQLSDSEQKQLHRIEAIIHHELTHFTRVSTLRKNYAQSIATATLFPVLETARWALGKYIPSGHPAGWLLKTTLYGLTGIGTVALGFKAAPAISKWEELQADEGIPNQRHLLEALAAECEEKHKRTQATVANIAQGNDDVRLPRIHKSIIRLLGSKTIDRYPFIYELLSPDTTHPTYITRARRFRKRIAELDKRTAQQEQLSKDA